VFALSAYVAAAAGDLPSAPPGSPLLAQIAALLTSTATRGAPYVTVHKGATLLAAANEKLNAARA
jgi:hypothetical protein